MLWRRYRSTIGWALLVAAGAGSFLGFALYMGGNPDYRAHAGPLGLVYWLALGAILGVTTAIAALVGGAIALLVRDRGLTRSPQTRIVAGTIGAAVGAIALWLGIGIVNAVVTEIGGSFFGLAILIALISAVVTAIPAGLLLNRAERRAASNAGV